MSPIQLVFLIVSAVGLLSALGTVLARNLVHAALFLVAFFFAIACQFVLLEAEFLAAMQVLVYIGAVSILLLFGIMLTRNVQGDETTGGHWGWKLPAGIVALGVLGVLLFGINAERGRPGQEAWARTTSRPGGVNPRVGGPASVALASSPSGQFVASADADGRVRLWTPGGRQVAAFPIDGPIPTALAFSPESALIAAADGRGAVRAWRALTRRAALERSGGLPGPISALALGPIRKADDHDDRVVAAGGADGVVRLWNGPEPAELPAHDGPVLAMAFTPDGLLITAGADRTIATWDLDETEPSRRPIAPAGRPVAAVAFGPVRPTEAPQSSDPNAPPPPPPPVGGLPGPLVAVASLVRGEPGRWDLRVLNAPDGAEVASFEGLRGVPVAVSLAGDARRVAALVLPEPGPEAPPEAEARAEILTWALDPADDAAGPIEVPPPRLPIGPDSRIALGAGGIRLAMTAPDAPMAFFDDREGSWTGPSGPATSAAAAVADMPRAVGDELMTRYVLPFEVAGLLLTAALVGAIVLARQEPRDAPNPSEAAADRPGSVRAIPRGGEPAAILSGSPGDGVPKPPDARPPR